MSSKGLLTSISVGVNKDSYDLLAGLAAEGLAPEYATVDIAHGHSVRPLKGAQCETQGAQCESCATTQGGSV